MNADQLLQAGGDKILDQPPSAVLQELAAFLSSPTNLKGKPQKNPLSAPMRKKLIALINCQLDEERGRICAMQINKYLGEQSLRQLILHHQDPKHLSADLLTAVRARGCQFLGPVLQDEILKLILMALGDGSSLSRKVLVMFVLQRLAPEYPRMSKSGIGHVLQLLYRACCFEISKGDCSSSLLRLKEKFCSFEALRRRHDVGMVQIAAEAGLYISPELWSSILYGDAKHVSYMQSIISKFQEPQTFLQSMDELIIILQRSGDPGNLYALKPYLEFLARIDTNSNAPPPSLEVLKLALNATKFVLKGLVEFVQNSDNLKLQKNKQIHVNNRICHAFNKLSISENCPCSSPAIDSSSHSHFSDVQVNNICHPSSFYTLPKAVNSSMKTYELNPESPVFIPSVKLPRPILKQPISATNTSHSQNINSSLSTCSSSVLVGKLTHNSHVHSLSSVDPCSQNRVMPTVHCQDPCLLKSELDNQSFGSNQNLADFIPRKNQLQDEMSKVEQPNGCLSESENNVNVLNMHIVPCFFKLTKGDCVPFDPSCISRRKITGRHGGSGMSYTDSTFSPLNLPYNGFYSTKSKANSEVEDCCVPSFCPSDEDDVIPFEQNLVSKYGHISRCSDNLLYGLFVNIASEKGELTTPTSKMQHSMPNSSLTASFCAATSHSSSVTEAGVADQYLPIIEPASVLMSVTATSVNCSSEKSDFS